MFDMRQTALAGCVEIHSSPRRDPRGTFVKTFHAEAFAAAGLRTDFREQYYSISGRGVVRGLHFQRPPHDHAKLVYCTEGAVQDAAVDLRLGSPSFGQHIAVNLTAEEGNMIYLAAGVAHGFATLSEKATLIYNVTCVYNQEDDAGIRWDSVGIPWRVTTPLLSDRDAHLPAFSDFPSPFRF